MTRQKTKKGIVKRIKLTKTGKVRRYATAKGHFRVVKSGTKRRNLKRARIVKGKFAATIRALVR